MLCHGFSLVRCPSLSLCLPPSLFSLSHSLTHSLSLAGSLVRVEWRATVFQSEKASFGKGKNEMLKKKSIIVRGDFFFFHR